MKYLQLRSVTNLVGSDAISFERVDSYEPVLQDSPSINMGQKKNLPPLPSKSQSLKNNEN